MKVIQHYSQIDQSKCIACHICERRCPGRAITVGKKDDRDGTYLSPCRKACPTNVNVAGYVGLVADRRFEEAYKLILKDNPFPSVCGRICTHPCEGECNRGHADKPIAIRELKRFVADNAYANGEPESVKALPHNGKSVGIIGAGPSGLTAAYYLALLGYEVDVYEEEPVAGGVLAYGIPEYRLPKSTLKKEIEHILKAGVKLHLNCSVGKDVTVDALKAQHDAIYMATGAKFSKKMGVPGEDMPGVIHGLDFLRAVNLKKDVFVGKNVVVVGGGNTAMDVSRTLVRLGADSVKVVYRRGIIDMPAEHIEQQEALEEGVKFVPMTAPVEVIGDGSVKGLKCRKTQLVQADGFGRRKVEEIPDSDFMIECDMVVPAVSQYFDLPFAEKEAFELSAKGNFVTDEATMMTSVEGIFAGGDMARGANVAVRAIADGKLAAINIDKYLGGTGVLNTGDEIELPEEQHEDSLFKHERFPIEYLKLEDRKETFNEAVLGFDIDNAVAEARRCLRCDTQYKASVNPDKCLDCGLCVEFCPQGAPELILRETPKALKVKVKEEDMAKIAEICKKAHEYPSANICGCNNLFVAEVCQAIIDGAHSPEELARTVGTCTGCGGIYCNAAVQRLLAAAGYPVQDSDDHMFLHNELNMWSVPQETIDSHEVYQLDIDKENYFKPELFENYMNVFPKRFMPKKEEK